MSNWRTPVAWLTVAVNLFGIALVIHMLRCGCHQ